MQKNEEPKNFFLSTFDIDPKLRRILFRVDIVTLVFFNFPTLAPELKDKAIGYDGYDINL